MTQDIGPRGRKSITKFRKNLATAERVAVACRLYYAERQTYRQIAEALGFHDESCAKKAADRGLKAIQVRGNETLIAEVRARIEENREFVKGIRDNPPQKVSPTGALVFGRDGEPVYDSQVSVAAAAELRKLDQQAIDLLGLAAPRRSITAMVDAGSAWSSTSGSFGPASLSSRPRTRCSAARSARETWSRPK